MKFLSQIFDLMFAPAGTFDPASVLYDAANDSSICDADSSSHHDTFIAAINPATCLPMIDCGDGMGGISGIDIGGSPFGLDIHHDHYIAANDSVSDNDCGSTFDHSSSFDCGSMFDSGILSGGFGSGCD